MSVFSAGGSSGNPVGAECKSLLTGASHPELASSMLQFILLTLTAFNGLGPVSLRTCLSPCFPSQPLSSAEMHAWDWHVWDQRVPGGEPSPRALSHPGLGQLEYVDLCGMLKDFFV